MKFSINEAQENIIGDFAMCLLNAVTAAHIHHFGTDSYSQHVALGDFYENIEDLADKFIEAYHGQGTFSGGKWSGTCFVRGDRNRQVPPDARLPARQ
jgi:hypothetical protein